MSRIIDEEWERDIFRPRAPEREKSRVLSKEENRRELAKVRNRLNSAKPQQLNIESAA